MNIDTDKKEVTVEQKYALVLLIKAIMSQLDEVASLRKQGYSANIAYQLLVEMCIVLGELEDHMLKEYFNLLISLKGKDTRCKEVPYSEDYEQAAEQAKKRFIHKIRTDLFPIAA